MLPESDKGGGRGVLYHDKKGTVCRAVEMAADPSCQVVTATMSTGVPRNWLQQSHPQRGVTVRTIAARCSAEASVRGLAAGAAVDSDVYNRSLH